MVFHKQNQKAVYNRKELYSFYTISRESFDSILEELYTIGLLKRTKRKFLSAREVKIIDSYMIGDDEMDEAC